MEHGVRQLADKIIPLDVLKRVAKGIETEIKRYPLPERIPGMVYGGQPLGATMEDLARAAIMALSEDQRFLLGSVEIQTRDSAGGMEYFTDIVAAFQYANDPDNDVSKISFEINNKRIGLKQKCPNRWAFDHHS